jgi:hypothetical protein
MITRASQYIVDHVLNCVLRISPSLAAALEIDQGNVGEGGTTKSLQLQLDCGGHLVIGLSIFVRFS